MLLLGAQRTPKPYQWENQIGTMGTVAQIMAQVETAAAAPFENTRSLTAVAAAVRVATIPNARAIGVLANLRSAASLSPKGGVRADEARAPRQPVSANRNAPASASPTFDR